MQHCCCCCWGLGKTWREEKSCARLPSPHLLRCQHKPLGLALEVASPKSGNYWVGDDRKQLSFTFRSLRMAETRRRPPYWLEAAAVAAFSASSAKLVPWLACGSGNKLEQRMNEEGKCRSSHCCRVFCHKRNILWRRFWCVVSLEQNYKPQTLSLTGRQRCVEQCRALTAPLRLSQQFPLLSSQAQAATLH